MSELPTLLVIEEEDQVGSVVELAVEGLGVKVFWEHSLQKAKRALLGSTPLLIVCKVVMGDNAEAGFEFAADLQAHPVLKNIPVLLVTDSVQDQILRKATESGARGLIPWPLKVDLLRQRIVALLPKNIGSPSITTEEPSPKSSATKTASAQTETQTDGAASARQANASDPREVRLAAVRKILAAVFLRIQQTENLTAVKEQELPKLVLKVMYELFRPEVSVKTPEVSVKTKAAPVQAEKPAADLDFEAVFGKKK